MKYTVRFAHLAEVPNFKVGETVKTGDILGIMGMTGQSAGVHLHIDCAEGEQTEKFFLSDYSNGKKVASKKQLDYFIDAGLFGVPLVVTTQWEDAEYLKIYRKLHRGYDVVPYNRHSTKENYGIRWNRTRTGTVTAVLDDPKGYGNCIYVCFEV